jgi:hypothetical protein
MAGRVLASAEERINACAYRAYSTLIFCTALQTSVFKFSIHKWWTIGRWSFRKPNQEEAIDVGKDWRPICAANPIYLETLHHTLWYPRYHRSFRPSELAFSLYHGQFRDVSLDEEIGLQSDPSHEWPRAELGIDDPVRLTSILCPALHAHMEAHPISEPVLLVGGVQVVSRKVALDKLHILGAKSAMLARNALADEEI